ncbi:hypothetical protein C7293_01095 [filamentous cyanobacterium CCT1]|nr:hypothetical protein C7293_01095 [filamentous cyanobacterium CCT1]PSN76284.1 hypothetical protein C8B47_28120 [filamentous cyanobacterium CCP4]
MLTTLGFSGLAFATAGLLIRWVFPISQVTLLIDRSYCPEAQWQEATQPYRQLYRQHQHRQLQIKQVILFNTLGVEHVSSPPSPEAIQQLSTYGQPNPTQQENLQKSLPNAWVISCHLTGPPPQNLK